MIIFEPFFNAAKERFLMYTNGSYLAKQVMQVPEELILRKDVSELLPVYMLMYAKYSPFYDLRFYD